MLLKRIAFSGYKARERKASRRKGEDELRTRGGRLGD